MIRMFNGKENMKSELRKMQGIMERIEFIRKKKEYDLNKRLC
ncbi:hypothetical protein SAMN04488577_3086 [Bacillus sp. cl95]|nr:hypothetical protein SAMN02799634_10532 [Bacillus sp. UNCCL13]SFQ87626.1 hypothetical protein SAMN04488577_3086 [Bacillus sp. cl95]